MSESTDTITIRVPKLLKTKLEEMSKKNQLTLNLTINQILTKNVQWDEHLTKMGWLQFEPGTVKEIFKHLNQEEINEISFSIKNDIINAIKFIYGDISLKNIVDFIEMWLRSTNTPFRHMEDEGSHKFFIKHTIGKNWSSFAVKVSEDFIQELGFKVEKPSIEVDAYSFSILKN